MNKAETNSLLKDEYFQIERVILDFDQRAITIKAWSVTASMAGISASFLSDSYMLLLLASLSSIVFWTIEGFWKQFQSAHYKRCGDIEKYFAGKHDILIPLQIANSWIKTLKKGGNKRLWKIMCMPHVALPHILIADVGIIILNLALNGTIEI